MNEEFIKLEEKFSLAEDEFRRYKNKILITIWEGGPKMKEEKIFNKNEIQELKNLYKEEQKAFKVLFKHLKQFAK